MAKPKQPLLKISDFENISYSITAVNSTTKTKVANTPSAELIELRENGCVMKISEKSCSVGHFLSISLMMIPQLKSVEFTAKVLSKEKADKHSSLVELEFYQIEQNQWYGFLKVYADKQAQVMNIIRSMKE